METFWTVARSSPQHEAFAFQWIERAGFEAFLPKIITKGGITPLFKNYLFVNVDDRPWQRVDRCPGVAGLIKFGETPARCPDAEIIALKARCDENGLVRLPPPPSKRRRVFVKGEPVKITAGPFAGLAGVHSGMSTRQREFVLLRVLGAETRDAIDPAFIQVIAP